MKWPPEQRDAICLLNDFAQIHDGDIIANVLNDTEIVGNEKVGQTQFLLQLAKEIEDLGLDRDVECRDRLVAHNEVGLTGQCTRHTDALSLSPRELMRKQRLLFGAQTDLAEKVRNADVPFSTVSDFHEVKRLPDNGAGAHAWIEG